MHVDARGDDAFQSMGLWRPGAGSAKLRGSASRRQEHQEARHKKDDLRESDYVQREPDEPVKKVVDDRLRDPFIATKKGEGSGRGTQKGGGALGQTKGEAVTVCCDRRTAKDGAQFDVFRRGQPLIATSLPPSLGRRRCCYRPGLSPSRLWPCHHRSFCHDRCQAIEDLRLPLRCC